MSSKAPQERSLRPAHPVFSRVYRIVAAAGEHTGLARLRTRTLAPAYGRLLAVGIGPGFDLAHLPSSVTSVIGVEPDPGLRRAAAGRARACARPCQIVGGVAEHLPLADESVDSVLAALVLCSVESLPEAAAEIFRVCRPGGVVCLLEHVRAADGTLLGRLQDQAARWWPRVAGGCLPNQRTASALSAAGFDLSGTRDVKLYPALPLISTHLVGVARRPDTPAAADRLAG